ncbi:outer membrane protein assembly factor BamC [Motiliproteus coralliicola]|uniref:Outer membrane protein assembly factor BamC n=1 Tax=Motiliproteus coralliicola TaxID=2283196 RepID=A0A369WUM9_9GAMM|nr:outer membrane protein assembly factor BamC [Motiliproteus coralliicola]RDE24264.1 outer membrane protein assembly factor BamC [Motiliproteus coralliicola]
MHSLNRVVLAASFVALSGCETLTNNFLYGGEDAVIRDRGQDYEKSEIAAPLVVPSHLDSERIQNTLEIPDIGTAAVATDDEFEIPRPDFFIAEAGNEKVNLAREGQQRLIVVNEPIGQVWTKVQDFWGYNDQAIAISDPRQGMMETAWIDSGGEEPGFFSRMVARLTFSDVEEGPTRDKLRVYLRPDLEDQNKTSIRLDHLRTSTREAEEPADWSGKSKSVSYQSEVMYDLLHYLSKNTIEATASAERARRAQQGRVFIGRDSRGKPVLKMTVPVDQAWDMLESSLLSADVDVGSFDRSLGKYYITYSSSAALLDESEDDVGFLDWLHGNREDIKISSEVLATALGAEEDPNEGPRYSSKPEVELADNPDLEQQRLAAQDGYKIWLGDRIIYVFGNGDQGGDVDPETGELVYTGRYQVAMTRRSSGVYVSLLTDKGIPAPVGVAEELFWKLRDQMQPN